MIEHGPPEDIDLPPYDALRALCATAVMLRSATCVGNPTLTVRSMYAWMKKLVPGALVMEESTSWHSSGWEQRVGILLREETRYVCIHEHRDPNLETCPTCPADLSEDCDPEGRGRFHERYTWIQTLTTKHRRYNASFIRIPRNTDEVREAEGRL